MQRTIAIVGLGYVGVVLAMFACEKGLKVYGIDKSAEVIAKLTQGVAHVKEESIPELVQQYYSRGKFTVSQDMSSVKDVDVILVTVGTPLKDDYSPDMSAIEEVSTQLAKHLRKGHLVIYKSTVIPGTLDDTVLTILEKGSGLKAGTDFMLAFCPERLGEGSRMTDFSGSALEEVRSLPIIVSGIDSPSAKAATGFWSSLGLDTVRVSSTKVAEMAKLADNCWIDLNIAMANELALLCEKMGINTYEVIMAANTLPKNNLNVNILLPGSGVGGSCLPKDPWFVHRLGMEHGLDLKTCRISREVNDRVPAHMYELIADALKDIGKDVKGAKVSILGLAFKQATGDMRNTPSAPLIRLLVANGAQVKAFDPWVDKEEAHMLFGDYVADSLEEALKQSDCLAVITPHPEFRSLPFDEMKSLVAPSCAIIDGRRGLDPRKVTAAGFTYWVVGIGKM